MPCAMSGSPGGSRLFPGPSSGFWTSRTTSLRRGCLHSTCASGRCASRGAGAARDLSRLLASSPTKMRERLLPRSHHSLIIGYCVRCRVRVAAPPPILPTACGCDRSRSLSQTRWKRAARPRGLRRLRVTGSLSSARSTPWVRHWPGLAYTRGLTAHCRQA